MELLAPAGNMACLKAAVSAGADALYFAGRSFGARSFADNFSEQELAEAVAYCHLRGVKAYVTVNTMVLDREFRELDAAVSVLAEAGADGVIVQDLGVLRRIRQICPDLPIHASTQMTVHSLDGVRVLEDLGVRRVVLARELTAAELAHIAAHCSAELEVFVHGAMCMSYSGQCLMSSVLGGRSGNRGKCAQPCRLAYHQENEKEQCYLSLKDMSLMHHLKELSAMGIASLKIEGRMKGETYVSTVVETYRRCLDEGRAPYREEEARVNRVFYRGGLTDGYFTNQKGVEMFAFDKPDNPYARNEQIQPELPAEKTVSVACRAVLKEGALPELELSGLGHQIKVQGEEPLPRAKSNPISEEEVIRRVSKTGGTAFVFTPIEVTIAGSPFVPVKALNQLRRAAVERLEEAINQAARLPFVSSPLSLPKSRPTELKLTASVRTLAQYEAIKDLPFTRIDVPLSLAAEEPTRFAQDLDRVVLCPPAILPDSEREAAEETLASLHDHGFTRLRAENLHWLAKADGWKLCGSHRLNVANSMAAAQLAEMGLETICLSAELNLAQVRDIRKPIPTELLLYGHLPLMITENCILKNMQACPCDGAGVMLDRKGKAFPILKDGDACRSVVLNSVPLYLADWYETLQGLGLAYGRLWFTIESPEDCRQLAQEYMGLKPPQLREGGYTRLHMNKGVL